MKREGERPEPNRVTRGLSAPKIRRHCEGSLRRLRTEVIDLYQMHHIDRDCPWEEIWQAMGSLVTQGKVNYVGSSNFAGWDIATACQEAARRGMQGLASEQSIYHLNNRTVELEVIPACRHYGLGLIPWSPLGWRAPGRRPRLDHRGPPRGGGLAEKRGEEPFASWRPTRDCARSLVIRRRR